MHSVQGEAERVTLSYGAFFSCNFLFTRGEGASCYHRVESDGHSLQP